MRFNRRPRYFLQPNPITPRRLAAAAKAIATDQARLGMFAASLEWETPEERLERIESANVAQERDWRLHAARNWIQGRRRLAQVAPDTRQQILAAWDAHGCPADPHYFAGFVIARIEAAEAEAEREHIADNRRRIEAWRAAQAVA